MQDYFHVTLCSFIGPFVLQTAAEPGAMALHSWQSFQPWGSKAMEMLRSRKELLIAMGDRKEQRKQHSSQTEHRRAAIFKRVLEQVRMTPK